MLRAVRFAAKLDATIEAKTHAQIKPLAKLISNVPHSRLFDETLKLLTCGNALNCLKQLRTEGLHEGIIPLLDLVLKQEGGQKFIEITLDRTDQRIRTNRPVNASFLYAAILWPLVQAYYKKELAKPHSHPMPALVEATNKVLAEQVSKLALQKRHIAEMREIWFTQPRFEKRTPRFIWRMIEQTFFRAACDFLQIRAACHEFDSVLAQWWMDLANAPNDERVRMVEALGQGGRTAQNKTKGTSGEEKTGARKRRPRRRSSRKKWQEEGQSSGGSSSPSAGVEH